MLRLVNLPQIVLVTLPSLLLAGCPDAGRLIPILNSVQVELVNDTSFPVDPNIRYDDDEGFLAGWFPADTLSTGLIESGEVTSFRFDCDELGLILADEAEQVVSFFNVYVADATDILERDDEYDCGDVIRFRFVGDAYDFGVIVSVNGRIVD